jgi:hypothetical protein
MKHDSIHLSEMQVAVLLFFANRRDLPPRGSTATTTSALIARGLLARDIDSGRYQTTDLGRQVAADLDHEAHPELHRN